MTEQTSKVWMEEAWQRVAAKVGRTSVRIGDSFPYVSIDGRYNAEPCDWWTNGFWPGLLWLLYRETGEARLQALAESCEAKLDEPLQAYEPLHHDVGFMWSLSAVANYKLTGNTLSKRRALTAASHLMGRYNARGHFLRAWNGGDQQGWAIIDCMMNLPLLYWASETTQDPRFRHVAVEHANMTLKEFVREDGSVNHIVCFDPETGERLEARGGQGYAADSAWSRGTAWAIYGFTLSCKYTGDLQYLQAAKKIAHYFLANLAEDCVPNWDFRAPLEENMAKDSTASACAASGLLELSRLVPAAEAKLYASAGAKIVQTLYERYGAWDCDDEEALIVMGTANRPRQTYVNVPIIYGDYFFTEALLKLRERTELFW
jgi:unsaturated chondroitin disaccharide hydrolase